jgi:hypothetical protein
MYTYTWMFVVISFRACHIFIKGLLAAFAMVMFNRLATLVVLYTTRFSVKILYVLSIYLLIKYDYWNKQSVFLWSINRFFFDIYLEEY